MKRGLIDAMLPALAVTGIPALPGPGLPAERGGRSTAAAPGQAGWESGDRDLRRGLFLVYRGGLPTAEGSSLGGLRLQRRACEKSNLQASLHGQDGPCRDRANHLRSEPDHLRRQFLEVFWKTHDPTTLNRQGPDVGTQYRSAIFYHNDEQRQLAERYKRQLDAAGAFNAPIVTQIVPFREFFPAEQYHQDYYELNSRQPYCNLVIRPKVEKVEKVFHDKLKTAPTERSTTGDR